MLLPKYEEIPMKCIRLTFPQKTYDVFIQDEYDKSTCVNIIDEQDERVPFNEWDNILMFLNIKNNVGVE